MSEIEKLMQNAGIKKKAECTGCKGHIGLGQCDSKNGCINKLYPVFTAEKQIKLIRHIALNDNIDYVKYYYQSIKGVWVFICVTVTELASEMPKVYGAYQEEFEQALAGLINTLWQDLTEQEKAEIKEILNGC